MPVDKNRNSVLRQLAALQKMSLGDLKEKWKDLYGTEPPNYGGKFLIKRLSHRIQELFYGGLSERTKEKIKQAGKDEEQKKKSNKRGFVLPGTRFVREWNDKRYEVVAHEDGFELDGRKFRSLSAVATEITGTHWNGIKFFGANNG
jgi:hypothetical protein